MASMVVAMLIAWIAPTQARSDTPASPAARDKLLARRAAEADCYRKLAETVHGVRITSDTYVRDFVAESDEIRGSLDTLIAGVRLGPPRYYDDGICEVDGELAVSKLVERLTEIHRTLYKGKRIRELDIRKIKQELQTDVIHVTGSGVARSDLPPDLPAGVEARLTPLPAGPVLRPSRPPLWGRVMPQGRLLAERAARLDAVRKLLEHIPRLERCAQII
ncbi:MAG: hypothetical protein ACE5EX_12630, partial [Phycisphaerae bacterium]